MAVETDVIYRNRDQIVADMIQRMQSRIADIWVEEDGNFRMFTETVAETAEGVYLANQILRDNIFIPTANFVELRRHGEQFGLSPKQGVKATGTLRITGVGGTAVLAGTVFGVDVGEGDALYYLTSADGLIPNPGDPTAPTLADGGAGLLTAGTYEYLITFVTAAGETEAGAHSLPLVQAVGSRQINLTNIPIGGTGTTNRRVYRQKDGGGFKFVATISNAGTTYTDNIADGSLGAAPPSVSTAEAVTVAAVAEDFGAQYNVAIGTVLELIDVPDGVTDVTNPTAFVGGTDEEDLETFRLRLLDFIRNPKTGSPGDMEVWAEEIDGVDTATAFTNDNLGVATPGHVTVRIAGPDGAVPGAPTIAAVLDLLVSKDIATITIHVATFTAVPTNVTVATTLLSGYLLADVSASVQAAIIDYINSVPVGGTVYIAGIYDAVYGLPGIATLVVSVPATDQTATATQKRTPGTITVT